MRNSGGVHGRTRSEMILCRSTYSRTAAAAAMGNEWIGDVITRADKRTQRRIRRLGRNSGSERSPVSIVGLSRASVNTIKTVRAFEK